MTKRATTRVVLIGADLRSGNRGINALTMGTIFALAQRFEEQLELVIINSSGPADYTEIVTVTGRQFCIQKHRPRLRQLLSSLAKMAAIRIVPPYTASSIVERNRLLKAIHEADIVIDLSEGDSFTTIYGSQRLLRHSLQKALPIAMGKEPVLFPQTIGPFQSMLSRLVAETILNHSRLIFTRDPYSTAIVNGMIKDKSKVIEAADMAFLMEAEESPELASSLPDRFIGINISGLLFNMDDLASNSLQIKWKQNEYRHFCRGLIQLAVADWKCPVLIIPHVRQPDDPTDDLEASRELAEQLPVELGKHVTVLDAEITAQNLKYVIGRADFFVGARMHSCIAALSTCTPLMVISYSHKFEGILRQLGLENLSCHPDKSSPEEMLAQIYEGYRQRSQIRSQLRQTIPSVRARALTCVSYL